LTPAAPELSVGGAAKVKTPNGTEADVQYALADLSQVRTSFDQGYDQSLQPRNTSRVSSRERIEQRKADMDPEAMGAAYNAGDGAPILTPGGDVITRNHGTEALRELYREGRANKYRDWVIANAEKFGLSREQAERTPNVGLVRVLRGGPTDLTRFAEEANMPSVAKM
jgi:hypothetical protein